MSLKLKLLKQGAFIHEHVEFYAFARYSKHFEVRFTIMQNNKILCLLSRNDLLSMFYGVLRWKICSLWWQHKNKITIKESKN